ncbi:hypothetical protein NPIL_543281 [Nephila pilipes]|uniref:Uncharacterized protein n=1 Tax=Nephila pilipes TaxID=299642 RepID=A0A8X6Q084_NEPPI|nr:hypothetical protein NPIL_543281 [Nephila pilipes]
MTLPFPQIMIHDFAVRLCYQHLASTVHTLALRVLSDAIFQRYLEHNKCSINFILSVGGKIFCRQTQQESSDPGKSNDWSVQLQWLWEDFKGIVGRSP